MKNKRVLMLIALSLSTTACNSEKDTEISENDYKTAYGKFDEFYFSAKNGNTIDCNELVALEGYIEPQPSPDPHHDNMRELITLHNYLYSTNKSASGFGQCESEIEIARVDICDKAKSLISDVNKKNSDKKEDSKLVFGFYIPKHQSYFCTEELRDVLNRTVEINTDKDQGGLGLSL